MVNGKRVSIRPNLSTFLVLARKFKIADWLGIDAICINQQDTMERNHQVQQMADIYRAAKHVLIHPGDTARRPACFPLRAAMLTRLAVRIQVTEFDLSIKVPWYKIRSCADAMCFIARAVSKDTCNLPYWWRSWVAQEIFLAKECHIICRRGLLAWDRFRGVGAYYTYLPLNYMDHSTGSFDIQRQVRSSKPPLVKLLIESDRTECSDPRDRLFSVLGMVEHGRGFTVDYSMSNHELLLEALEYFLPKSEIDRDQDILDAVDFLRSWLATDDQRSHTAPMCCQCALQRQLLSARTPGLDAHPGEILYLIAVEPSIDLLYVPDATRDSMVFCTFCDANVVANNRQQVANTPEDCLIRISKDELVIVHKSFCWEPVSRKQTFEAPFRQEKPDQFLPTSRKGNAGGSFRPREFCCANEQIQLKTAMLLENTDQNAMQSKRLNAPSTYQSQS